MRIHHIAWKSGPEYDELSAQVWPGGPRRQQFAVWFRFPPGVVPASRTADPFVAGFLIPCMHEHEDLHIDAPVSPRLLKATEKVQSIITGWYPEYARISLTCEGTYDPPAAGAGPGGVGCCFSGGIDSWYTFLKHEAEVTHCVLIRGLDIRIGNDWLWAEATRRLSPVAINRGKVVVTVETNLREVADLGRCPWGKERDPGFYAFAYLASALAAVGLALQGLIAKLLIPSGQPYGHLAAWGSHPLLNPLWSTEHLEVIHDGCEANRMQKMAVVAQHRDAVGNLRVCLDNVPGRYNCCECLKCLRTMAGLRLVGVLDRAATFPRPLDLKRIRRARILDFNRAYWEPSLSAAAEAGDTELLKALEAGLGKRFSLSRWLYFTRRRFISLARRAYCRMCGR